MIALLHSDTHRIARSRWFWVVLGAVALIELGSAALTLWWPLDPALAFDGLTGRSGALRLAGRGMSIQLVVVLAPFVAASLSCADSDSGFNRTLLASLRARASYFAEKFVLVALLTALLVVAYLVFAGLGVLVLGAPVHNMEPLWQVAAWTGCAGLIACVYAFITLLAGQLTRSRAFAFVLAFMLVIGFPEQLLMELLALIGHLLGPSLEAGLELAYVWFPSVSLNIVLNGAAGLFSPDVTGLAPVLRILLVCVPLGLALAALGSFIGSRRDLA